MRCKIYEVLEHTADLKVAFYGNNLLDLFFNGFEGLKRLLYLTHKFKPTKDTLPSLIKYTVNMESKDSELLFVDWLRNLLSLSQTNNLIPVSLDYIEFTDHSLTAQVSYRVPTHKDKLNYIIKAVTYHQAKIAKARTGIRIGVVFDVAVGCD